MANVYNENMPEVIATAVAIIRRKYPGEAIHTNTNTAGDYIEFERTEKDRGHIYHMSRTDLVMIKDPTVIVNLIEFGLGLTPPRGDKKGGKKPVTHVDKQATPAETWAERWARDNG